MEMNLWALLQKLINTLTWWVIVAPWEQALRVRWGKRVKRLGAGLHLKIPIVDLVFKQSVRQRLSNPQLQTLSTKDGKTVTLGATLGYAITNLEQLYQTLHHAEDTLLNLTSSEVAAYVHAHDSQDCTPPLIEAHVLAHIGLSQYGLQCTRVAITDFAYVRTFRLISDTKWGSHGDSLNTNRSVDAAS